MKAMLRKRGTTDKIKILKTLPDITDYGRLQYQIDNRGPRSADMKFFTLDNVTYSLSMLFCLEREQLVIVIHKTKDLKNWTLVTDYVKPSSFNTTLTAFTANKTSNGSIYFMVRCGVGLVYLTNTSARIVCEDRASTTHHNYFLTDVYRSTINVLSYPSAEEYGKLHFSIEKLVISLSHSGDIIINTESVRSLTNSLKLKTFMAMGIGEPNHQVSINVAASLALTDDNNLMTIITTPEATFISDTSSYHGGSKTSLITELQESLYCRAHAFSNLIEGVDAEVDYLAVSRSGRINFILRSDYRMLLSKTATSTLFPTIRFINCVDLNITGFVTRYGMLYNERLMFKRQFVYSAKIVKDAEEKFKIKTEIIHRRRNRENILVDMCDYKVYDVPPC